MGYTYGPKDCIAGYSHDERQICVFPLAMQTHNTSINTFLVIATKAEKFLLKSRKSLIKIG